MGKTFYHDAKICVSYNHGCNIYVHGIMVPCLTYSTYCEVFARTPTFYLPVLYMY